MLMARTVWAASDTAHSSPDAPGAGGGNSPEPGIPPGSVTGLSVGGVSVVRAGGQAGEGGTVREAGVRVGTWGGGAR
ncbi:hypothetical protein ScoT_58770 [Streptomyces albidoflavus]|uniref:Uncharacterized protein n=1 Tax=Streptomyces albidoflavus TaxID=1886 RepID=A0AA37C378_9ACTN|nr:hypothetical protein ScoT_58770 [Streptomyces albidoflavus]